ncbi:MAG TPA: abortive phage infection protein [Clostridiales bacterium]|nr:abortive phage infection protein [Clostridiales bacterium]
MLLQFNFKNFKSFRDDTTLDLTATKISEYSNHVITVGNEKVLPIAAIFGANASGKSNVQEAFRYMSTYVVSSFSYGGDESGKKSKSEFLQPTPFLFDANSKDAESLFEVYFISSEETGAKSYNYGFTVNQSGINEEWLNYKSKSSRGDYKKIFYRNGKELSFSGIALKSQENLKIALEKETLIVSLGSKLKIGKLKLIRDWFLNNEFAEFGRPVENYFLSKLLPHNFVMNKDVQQKVVNYFSAFDSSIIGFEVETLENDDDKKSSKVRIDAIHKMVDSDKTTTIPLKLESAGTLKMFALYRFLQNVLEAGSVLFVDELNARLHPLLVRTFIITFLNPEININHAQLIFTTHDSWQLNSNILRRDEVWFTEKVDTGISTLYSLADFIDEDGSKIRKDENYEKNYMLGKYGAIPTMKYFDMFKGE